MSNQKKVVRLIKKATKQKQHDLLNLGMLKDQHKELGKNIKLIIPTHIELFKTLKTNLIIFDKLEEYEGYAQLINRKLNRFDVTKFKEENPDTYTKYLVPMETNEIKIKVQSTEQAFCNLLDEDYKNTMKGNS